MRVASSLLVLAALTLGACQTVSSTDGVPTGRTNQIVQTDIQRRIDELRFLHGQQLLESMQRLSHLGEPAIPLIRAGARSDDWLTRASLAWVMGESGDRRYIPDLRNLTGDANAGVRYEAASALVELGDNAGFPSLVSGLADGDIKNRYKCFEALRRATGQDFGYQHDAAPEVRRAAVARWLDWLETVKASAL
jgi:HEAT repeat protein